MSLKTKSKLYKLKIYLKEKKSPFFVITCDNQHILQDLYSEINKSDEVVIFKNIIIFRKENFDKAIIVG